MARLILESFRKHLDDDLPIAEAACKQRYLVPAADGHRMQFSSLPMVLLILGDLGGPKSSRRKHEHRILSNEFQ